MRIGRRRGASNGRKQSRCARLLTPYATKLSRATRTKPGTANSLRSGQTSGRRKKRSACGVREGPAPQRFAAFDPARTWTGSGNRREFFVRVRMVWSCAEPNAQHSPWPGLARPPSARASASIESFAAPTRGCWVAMVSMGMGMSMLPNRPCGASLQPIRFIIYQINSAAQAKSSPSVPLSLSATFVGESGHEMRARANLRRATLTLCRL